MDFAGRYGPWAVVLGASEGLGAAWSRELASRGVDVVLVARRVDKLEELAAELRATGREVRVVSLDLATTDAPDRLLDAVADLDVGLVVYNACYSVIGAFLDMSREDKLRTLDVNARGPLLMADAWAPRLVARGRGGLLLVSSMSAFQGSAMVGVYASTKAFDIVLGETLWEELGPKGVDVLVVAAGATLTPNFEGVTPAAKRAGAYPMVPAEVARQGLDALGVHGPTFVPGAMNRVVHGVLSRLPRRWAVRFISRQTRSMYGG